MEYKILPAKKLIISGSLIEVLEYTIYMPDEKIIKIRKEKDKDKEIDPEKNLSSFYRSRSQLKRLLFSNCWAWRGKNGRIIPSFFLTLTFKENLQELRRANYEFTKFTQRLNYRILGRKEVSLKYICVPEFQKRGAVHFHSAIFNMPYVERVYDVLNEVWGLGFFWLKKIDDVKNVGDYLGKYMSKETYDSRLWNQKRYFASRGLKKPIIINFNNNNFIESILRILSVNTLRFEKTFYTKYCGDMNYKKYQLDKGQTLLDLELDEDTKNYLKSL